MAAAESRKKNVAVVSSNKYTLDFYKILSEENGNIFFSPASISIALAMAYLGCRENTADQLSKALHWKNIKDELLCKDMADFLEIMSKMSGSNNTITLANRFWVQESFEILDTYRQALISYFHSTVTEANFIQQAEKTRLEINGWVDKTTQGKIKDLIASGILTVNTRLVLVNAIYFKGEWENEFNEDETFTGKFHVTKDNLKDAQMMSRTGKYCFGESKQLKAQVLQLPYSQNQLSMIIILPLDIEGLQAVEQKLSMETLTSAISSLRKVKVEVTIPKFKLTRQFELSKLLPKMGVVDLFDENQADLSGITAEKALYVSNVIHKAFVEINEKGTEAAAATAVVMMFRSLPAPTPRFFANHPFLFIIQENSTGSILFMGRLMEP